MKLDTDIWWLQKAVYVPGKYEGTYRENLTGIHITPDRMESADGFRLHIVYKPGKEERIVRVNGGKRIARNPRREYSQEAIDSPYPNTDNVVLNNPGYIVRQVVNRKAILAAVRELDKDCTHVVLDLRTEKWTVQDMGDRPLDITDGIMTMKRRFLFDALSMPTDNTEVTIEMHKDSLSVRAGKYYSLFMMYSQR